MRAKAFFDTNVPLYLLSDDALKAGRAEELMASGGVISVQVLNEFTSVARRKYKAPWPAVEELLTALKSICRTEPLTRAVHEHAVRLSMRHQLSIYDACIVASALQAGCTTLYSDDLQHGQRFDTVTLQNPFR